MKKAWEKAEQEFVKIIEGYGKKAFLYRVTDTREASRGKTKVLIKKTPSDFILTHDGDMCYAEVKSCSNKTSFPFSAFTEGQMRAIIRQDRAGGCYCAYIKNENTGIWYKLFGGVILGYIERGHKSISWEELKEFKW